MSRGGKGDPRINMNFSDFPRKADILTGPMNQDKGRGSITKIISAVIVGGLLVGFWLLRYRTRNSAAEAQLVTISLASGNVATNGTVLVNLNMTNTMPVAVVVSVRAVISFTQNGLVTNYNGLPDFVGLAGPGSRASALPLDGGAGMSVSLSPVKGADPFQVEFVCFPQREGVGGLMDKAEDKVTSWQSGTKRQSYYGESFMALSPKIEVRE